MGIIRFFKEWLDIPLTIPKEEELKKELGIYDDNIELDIYWKDEEPILYNADEALKRINILHNDKPCDFCNNNSFTRLQAVYGHRIIMNKQENYVIKKDNFVTPSISLVCDKCGQMRFFNLNKLGFKIEMPTDSF